MSKVYQIVTDQIISLLEAGTIPWEKPWTGVDHKNMVSKKAYRGINPFMLQATALSQGYKSNYWVSYKQAQDKGGQVRKGEKSTLVIFWMWTRITDPDTDETVKRVPFLRYYRVFNIEQIEWPETFTFPVDELPDCFDPIATCEAMVAGMPNAPKIKTGDSHAYYSPVEDFVGMPIEAAFKTTAGYYAVLFHELTHSTGHPKRVGRFEPGHGSGSFGSQSYSKEELIAELGAAMLCGVCGIEGKTIDNHAAYIKSWLGALRDDPKLIVQAAAAAQKAADYIRGITWDNEEDGNGGEGKSSPAPQPTKEPEPKMVTVTPQPCEFANLKDRPVKLEYLPALKRAVSRFNADDALELIATPYQSLTVKAGDGMSISIPFNFIDVVVS